MSVVLTMESAPKFVLIHMEALLVLVNMAISFNLMVLHVKVMMKTKIQRKS